MPPSLLQQLGSSFGQVGSRPTPNALLQNTLGTANTGTIPRPSNAPPSLVPPGTPAGAPVGPTIGSGGPAPAPVAPAPGPAPQPAPAGPTAAAPSSLVPTGGGPALSPTGADPFTDLQTQIDALFGTTNTTPGSLDEAQALLELMNSAGINLPLNPNPDHFLNSNIPGAALLRMLSGPVFDSSDAIGLGFQEGGGPLGFSLNLALQQALQGESRGQDREGILRGIADQQAASPQAALADQLAATSTGLLDPAANDARFSELERQIRTQNAASLNSARNRMQDLGLAGQGQLQAPALASAEASFSRDLGQQLSALDQLRASERREDLAAAQSAAGISGDLQRAFQVDPLLNIVSSLGGPQNVQMVQLMDALERAGQLGSGVALANREPSFLQQVAPLVSGLGAIGGGALGGLLGNPGFFRS